MIRFKPTVTQTVTQTVTRSTVTAPAKATVTRIKGRTNAERQKAYRERKKKFGAEFSDLYLGPQMQALKRMLTNG